MIYEIIAVLLIMSAGFAVGMWWMFRLTDPERRGYYDRILDAQEACTAAQNECDLVHREANAARKLLDQDGRRRDKVTVESVREYVIFRAANNQSSRMKDKP